MTDLPAMLDLDRRGPVTPSVRVALDGGPAIWCKCEFMNPSGSTKDRIARHIVGKAWREGRLRAGDTVVEASSGSTSISLAMVCAQLGLKFVAVMPEGVSRERVLMIRGFGGRTCFTPRERGIAGALERCEALVAEQGAFATRQFENPDNAEAHRRFTAVELARQARERIDAVVSGVGTGGTIVGLGQGLGDCGMGPRLFVARPVCRWTSGGSGEAEAGAGRGGQGSEAAGSVSAGFGLAECCSFSCRIPGVIENCSRLFDANAVPHETLEVDEGWALSMTLRLIEAGFPVGPSSGLNYAAAVMAAERLSAGSVVATVFCDRMERYLSTDLFKGFECIGRATETVQTFAAKPAQGV